MNGDIWAYLTNFVAHIDWVQAATTLTAALVALDKLRDKAAARRTAGLQNENVELQNEGIELDNRGKRLDLVQRLQRTVDRQGREIIQLRERIGQLEDYIRELIDSVLQEPHGPMILGRVKASLPQEEEVRKEKE